MKLPDNKPLAGVARTAKRSSPGSTTANLFFALRVKLLTSGGSNSASRRVAVAPFGRSRIAGCPGGETYFEPIAGKLTENPPFCTLSVGVAGRDQCKAPSKSLPAK